jgi:predicted aconitase
VASNIKALEMLNQKEIGRRSFLKGMGCLGLGFSFGLHMIGCDKGETLRTPYSPVMYLTEEETAILNGEYGLTLQKVMETIVRYGDIFGADRLIPIDGPIHVVGSFGMLYLKPYFAILEELTRKGLKTSVPFTADPRPPMPPDYRDLGLGPLNMKATVFRVMYKDQDVVEQSLYALGLTDHDGYSCSCYLNEIGNTPEKGQILSWAESSAVSYANSVLGARTNRNRSEERRVGKECRRLCRSRWSPYH